MHENSFGCARKSQNFGLKKDLLLLQNQILQDLKLKKCQIRACHIFFRLKPACQNPVFEIADN